MMDSVRRKDLGSLGTRTLARCLHCGRILEVEYHHQGAADWVARQRAGETHRQHNHPDTPATLLPLDQMIWGQGKVPRMRKR